MLAASGQRGPVALAVDPNPISLSRSIDFVSTPLEAAYDYLGTMTNVVPGATSDSRRSGWRVSASTQVRVVVPPAFENATTTAFRPSMDSARRTRTV